MEEDDYKQHIRTNAMNYFDSLPANVRTVLNYVDGDVIMALLVIKRSFTDIRKPSVKSIIQALEQNGYTVDLPK